MNRVDERFPAMGGEARVRLESHTRPRVELERDAAVARAVLAEVECALSRFRPESELCELNGDPRAAVPASRLVHTLALAARAAGERSHGLVDATLLDPLEASGYAVSRAGIAPASLDYRPVWTALGIFGGYLAAALSLSYYARRRIGARRWRNAHRLIPVAWALAVAHVLGAGSDAGSAWLQAPLALTMGAVATLLVHRALGARWAGAERDERGAVAPARGP